MAPDFQKGTSGAQNPQLLLGEKRRDGDARSWRSGHLGSVGLRDQPSAPLPATARRLRRKHPSSPSTGLLSWEEPALLCRSDPARARRTHGLGWDAQKQFLWASFFLVKLGARRGGFQASQHSSGEDRAPPSLHLGAEGLPTEGTPSFPHSELITKGQGHAHGKVGFTTERPAWRTQLPHSGSQSSPDRLPRC